MVRDRYRRRIKDFEFKNDSLVCFDLNDHLSTSTEIVRFIKIVPNGRLFKIRTKWGREIVATEDHPFLTPEGMKEVRFLEVGDRVAIYPYKGVEYERPSHEVLVKGSEFRKGVKKELERKGLVPLHLDHEKIGILARLVGYLLGDGHVQEYLNKKKSGEGVRKFRTIAYGEINGLKELRKDVEELGFKPSSVRTRKRETEVESSVTISSSALSILLAKLGVPVGNKEEKKFRVPNWIKRSPKWIKVNFLAGLFGAELSKPSTLTNHPHTFSQPHLTLRKLKGLENGLKFLEDVKEMLEELGIEVNLIYKAEVKEKMTILRLMISSKEENLIKLWTTVGYAYQKEREWLACLAAEYLRRKVKYKSEVKNRSRRPRFPTFMEFVKKVESETGKSGTIYDEVLKKELHKHDGLVYDFTVLHKDHNFIANDFVVSNCGVRLLKTNLREQQVRPKLKELLDRIFKNIPSGVGKGGIVTVSKAELDELLEHGVEWAVQHGYGWKEDVEFVEENGKMKKADCNLVSSRAKERGRPQLGSLGGGNHFIEVQRVDRIYKPEVAQLFGIGQVGQIVVMIHTGSRGLGHQVCDDFLRRMEGKFRELVKELPDRELVYAPIHDELATQYFAAMCAAANYAWVNRQMITHWARQSFYEVFGFTPEQLDMHLIYDVAHNIAKIEQHRVDGEIKEVFVHRKGATRSFPAGNKEVPECYRSVGQPVIIPGSMGTASYLLVGCEEAMLKTFGSTAHGAGREMSRERAIRQFRGEQVSAKLASKGILIRAASWRVVAEEAPEAYKDIDEVARVSDAVGIAKLVARLVPIGVVKG